MRVSVAIAVACLGLIGLSAADESQASIKQQTHIPAQGLGPALQSLAKERNFQIVYVSEEISDRRTQGASGDLTIGEALTRLLNGTGLTYRYLDDNTVTVLPLSTASSAGTPSSAIDSATHTLSTPQSSSNTESPDPGAAKKAGFWQRFRLAQNDPSSRASDAEEDKESSRQDLSSPQETGKAIPEILVTAQKREERLRDVPISISVLRGDDLDRSTAEGTTEALNWVPGVATTVNYQGGGTQVAVRGVTASGPIIAGSSPIAYYLDSVPFGFVKNALVPDANAYDMERVEVLRGPQGTLYGASALNGVVRVLTKDADLDKFELKARTAGSSTEEGGANYRADMAVNAPIVEGKLAARAVVGYENLSGWIDKPIEKDANDAQLRNFRLKINAQPTDKLSVGLSGWLSRNDYGAQSIGTDEEQRNSLTAEPVSGDFDAYGLKIDYAFSAFSLSSMTSYIDYTTAGLLDFLPLGLANTRLQTTAHSKLWSQELNLNSERQGPWRWSVGGIYREADDSFYQLRTNYAGAICCNYVAPNQFGNTSESFAAFGQLTRLFLDGRLELTGGLRYFEDEVSGREFSRQSGTTALINTDDKFHKVTPRAVLTWHHSDLTTLYASFAEGFRSGLPQNPTTVVALPEFPPAKADNLKNYELGAKSELWNGRISFDTAVYYIDWQDVQQALLFDVAGAGGSVSRSSAYVNGESASGPGFEFAMTVRPLDRLVLGLTFNWNDLTMDADVLSGGILLFNEGDRLQLSPERTTGASAEYAFPFGGGGFEGQFSVSANYTSPQQVRTIAGNVQQLATSDSMLISRTSFSLNSLDDRWRTTLFVDNLTDEDGTPVRQWFGDNWNSRIRPRTIGAQLEYRF